MKINRLFTIIVLTGIIFGQYNPDNHVVTMSKSYFKQNPDGSLDDYAEKSEEYYTKMNRLNKDLTSSMVLGHYWTGSSEELLLLAEWKSIAAADRSQVGAADMRKKAWPNDEKRKAFFGAYNKYYTGKHKDVAVMELFTNRVKRHKKSQSENTVVHIRETYLNPMSKVEGGTVTDREALRDEYFEKVIMKNDKILSWRELRHYWSGSLGGGDIPIVTVTEYANLADADNNALDWPAIQKAWPDEEERKALFENAGKYSGWGHKDIGLHNNWVKLGKR